jgi:hypothetical protein
VSCVLRVTLKREERRAYLQVLLLLLRLQCPLAKQQFSAKALCLLAKFIIFAKLKLNCNIFLQFGLRFSPVCSLKVVGYGLRYVRVLIILIFYFNIKFIVTGACVQEKERQGVDPSRFLGMPPSSPLLSLSLLSISFLFPLPPCTQNI